MKDNLQNIADLIGALAEDIEEIKKKLDAKDGSDRYEALESLAVKLEPLIRFAGGKALDNINDIFRSEESIAAYIKSQGDVVIASLQANLEANEKDRHKRGIPTVTDLLLNIRKILTEHIEESKRISEKVQQNQRQAGRFSCFPKYKAISKRIKSLWRKIPDGWHKNPYAWAGIGCTLVFFALFTVSWVQWHEYREENRRLKTVADKHKVTTVILNELHPGLAVAVGAYERLAETVGTDSTLAIFYKQVRKIRSEEKYSKTSENK